jgi:glycosyltransferase involved in cell wall biosynthesis
MDVLVIIPSYNEEKSITKVISDLKKHCPSYDILVINDGSTDQTSRSVKRLDVNIIDLPYNLGIGGAIQTGYMYAIQHHYDFVVQMDGDGQHSAKEVQKIITPLIERLADYVIGSRFIHYEGFVSSKLRRIGICYLSILIKCLSRVNVKDVTSGFRALNQPVIRYLTQHYSWDYPEVEALIDLKHQQFRMMEVPVLMKSRKQGKSHFTYWRSVYYIIKVTLTLIVSTFRHFFKKTSSSN